MATFDIQITNIQQQSYAPEERDRVTKTLKGIVGPLQGLCGLAKAKFKEADLNIDETLDLAAAQYLPSGSAQANFVVMVANEKGSKTPAGFAVLSVPLRSSNHESFVYSPLKTNARSYNLNDLAEVLLICGQKGSASALFYEMTKTIDAKALYLEVAGGRIGAKGDIDLEYRALSGLKHLRKERKKLAETYRKKYGFHEVALLHNNQTDGKVLESLAKMIEPRSLVPQNAFFTQTGAGIPYSMLVDMKTLESRLPSFKSVVVPAAVVDQVKVPPALPPPILVTQVKTPVVDVEVPVYDDGDVPVTSPIAKKAPKRRKTPQNVDVDVPVRAPRRKTLRIELPPEDAKDLLKVLKEDAPPIAILPPEAPRRGPQIPASRFLAGDKKDDNKKGKSRGGKRKTRAETYKSYIFRILKQVHPDVGIGRRAMSIMNSIANDIFEQLASQGHILVRYNKKNTLKDRDIQTAVRLIFPGELAKHAVSEGTKAITKTKASHSS